MRIATKIATFALISGSATISYSQKAEFALSISIPQTTMRSGADIPVEIKIQNISDHEIPIFVSPGESGIASAFEVVVLNQTGAKIPETAAGLQAHGKTNIPNTISGGTMKIPVGGNKKYTTHISKIFDVSRPGRYTVQAQKLDKADGIIVKSNRIPFTVTP